VINISQNDLLNAPDVAPVVSGRAIDGTAFTGLLDQFDRQQQAEPPAKPVRQRAERSAPNDREDEPAKSMRRALHAPARQANAADNAAHDGTPLADAPAALGTAADDTAMAAAESVRQEDAAGTPISASVESLSAQTPVAAVILPEQPAAPSASVIVAGDDPAIASAKNATADKGPTSAAPHDESAAPPEANKSNSLAPTRLVPETAAAEDSDQTPAPAQQKIAAQAADLGKRLDNLPMQIAVQVAADEAAKPLKAPIALANGMTKTAPSESATTTQTVTATPAIESASAPAAKPAETLASHSPAATQNATPAFAAMIEAAAEAPAPTLTKPGTAEAAPVGGIGNSRAASANATQGASAVAKPTPQPHPATEQVAVHIAKASAEGVDKINVKLKPAALGSVEVQIDLASDGRVQVAVSADRADTLELLQRDVRALERALGDAGLQTDQQSFSFNLRDQGTQNGGASDGLVGPRGRQGDAEGIDESLPAVGGYLNARAAVGGVDIRV
jgi:flagellar hook-length control protein FliK